MARTLVSLGVLGTNRRCSRTPDEWGKSLPRVPWEGIRSELANLIGPERRRECYGSAWH